MYPLLYLPLKQTAEKVFPVQKYLLQVRILLAEKTDPLLQPLAGKRFLPALPQLLAEKQLLPGYPPQPLFLLAADERDDVVHHLRPGLKVFARAGNGLIGAGKL